MARRSTKKTGRKQNKRITTKEKLILLKKAVLKALIDYLDVVAYRGLSDVPAAIITASGARALLERAIKSNPDLQPLLNSVTILSLIISASLNSIYFILKKTIKYYRVELSQS